MLAEELAEFGRDSLHYGVYGKHVTIFDFYHVPRKKGRRRANRRHHKSSFRELFVWALVCL